MRCYIIKLLSNPCSTHMLELLLLRPRPLACPPRSRSRCMRDKLAPRRDRALHPASRRAAHRRVPTSLQPSRRPSPPRRARFNAAITSATSSPLCMLTPSCRSPRRRPCRPSSRSAKPLPPSCRIVPSPRRAASRAKAGPAAVTAAVRHNAWPTRPFTACRPCRLVANAVATPLKATRRALAQHPPLPPIKAAQATRHHHAEFVVPPAPSPFFFLTSISLSSVPRARTEARTPPLISLTSPSQANSSRGKHLCTLLHQPQLAAFALSA